MEEIGIKSLWNFMWCWNNLSKVIPTVLHTSIASIYNDDLTQIHVNTVELKIPLLQCKTVSVKS